jgi:predicted nucleic acid-binding protein
MRQKVYIETSIVSYLTSKPSRDIIITAHQQITNNWWENQKSEYDLYTSQIVIDEASTGDPKAAQERLAKLNDLSLLEITDDIIGLAEKLMEHKCLPPKAVEDSLHIAIASIHNMDYLLTWNCKHIANAKMRPLIEKVIYESGLLAPLICTPEELLGE